MLFLNFILFLYEQNTNFNEVKIIQVSFFFSKRRGTLRNRLEIHNKISSSYSLRTIRYMFLNYGHPCFIRIYFSWNNKYILDYDNRCIKEYFWIKRQLLVFDTFLTGKGTHLYNTGLNINKAKILHFMKNVIMRTQQCS